MLEVPQLQASVRRSLVLSESLGGLLWLFRRQRVFKDAPGHVAKAPPLGFGLPFNLVPEL
jgi:hypothetical protein